MVVIFHMFLKKGVLKYYSISKKSKNKPDIYSDWRPFDYIHIDNFEKFRKLFRKILRNMLEN